MSIVDLDRKAVTKHYEKWQRDLVFRPMSAGAFVNMEQTMHQLNGQATNTAEAIDFWCELLSMCCVDPQLSKDEWRDATVETLNTLGTFALEVCGLAVEQAKKN